MAPELEPKVMQAIEALGYRATVGDVAAQAGLRIPWAEQGLLTLASEVGGHMQVAETGDIAYTFPKNFRIVLFQKYWQLRLKQWFGKAWKILFYLIRISFGVVLILSIGILAIALIVAAIAAMLGASQDDNNSGDIKLGGFFYFIGELIESAFRLMFYADWLGWGGYSGGYTTSRSSQGRTRWRSSSRSGKSGPAKTELNFFEAIFSFLFGDGNPNADLEDRRWSTIAQVIRENRGAVFAEQLLPFLDETRAEPDDAMLPVLVHFQGKPQVSPQGELIYQFPALQVSASNTPAVQDPEFLWAQFLQERPWRFSKATSGQLWGACLLGGLNAGLALWVGLMLPDLVGTGLGFLTFVGQIYPLLLIYGLGFLLVPLVRWQVVKWRDRRVQKRNRQRQALAQRLQTANVQSKRAYAQQFAAQKQLNAQDSVYTTQTELISQEIDQRSQLDEAWKQQLQSD